MDELEESLEEELEEAEEEESGGPCGGRIGRYEIFYRLGRGGMATVYLGRLVGEVGFERWVAVKQIHEHLSDKARFRTMFLDEARVAAQLSHPNLVQVTDVGLQKERPYLVMEFVNGETLGHLILRSFRSGKSVPLPVAVRIVAGVCEGLHHAHELKDAEGRPRDLVHRDVSPHNILISYDGVVKVTDFGIVKAAGRSTHTRTGVIKGKPQYMSPEQILAKTIDRRADIFALGIILYETTLMRRLFKDVSDYEGLSRIVTGDIPLPRTLRANYPKSLEKIVMKALSLRPEQRYQTARELQGELERFLVKTGKAVGAAEVSEHMIALFGDRMSAREELLAWARSAGSQEFKRHELIAGESSPGSSDSLPGPDETGRQGRESAKEGKQPLFARLSLIALLVFALVMAVIAGFGVARTAAMREVLPRPLTTSEPPDGQPVKAAPTSPELPPEVGLVAVDAGSKVEKLPPDAAAAVLVWQEQPDGAPLSAEEVGPGDASGLGPPDARSKTPPRLKQPHRRQPLAPGTMSVMANPWCEVYLGGRMLGRTPLMRVSVPAGRHVLVFMPRGKRPSVRRTIRIRSHRHTPVSVNLY